MNGASGIFQTIIQDLTFVSFRAPDAEEKESRARKLLPEIMAENSPNLARDINLQIQEAKQISNGINSKIFTTRNITIKPPKTRDKEKNLESSKRNIPSL